MSRLIHTHPAIQNIFKNFPGFLREFYQTPEREWPFPFRKVIRLVKNLTQRANKTSGSTQVIEIVIQTQS